MDALRLLKGLFIWLALSSFFFGSGKEEDHDPFAGEDYVSMVHDIIARTAKKVSKELGADCCGTGGGMMDTVYWIAMDFQFCQEVELEQAREMIVKITEFVLNEVNSNKKIRPYLHNYPFTAKNLSLNIFFNTSDMGEVAFGEINLVGVLGGKVQYDVEGDERKVTDPYWKEETFEESVQLVEEYRKQRAQEGKR